MRPSDGVRDRIWEALKHLEGRLGHKVVQDEFGRRVSTALGRPKPYKQGTAQDWLDQGVRNIDVLWAIAHVCGVSYAWLSVNEGGMLDGVPSAATPQDRNGREPLQPVVLGPKVTQEERRTHAERAKRDRAVKRGRGGSQRRDKGA